MNPIGHTLICILQPLKWVFHRMNIEQRFNYNPMFYRIAKLNKVKPTQEPVFTLSCINSFRCVCACVRECAVTTFSFDRISRERLTTFSKNLFAVCGECMRTNIVYLYCSFIWVRACPPVNFDLLFVIVLLQHDSRFRPWRN